jgi:hypothetical protein
MRFVAKIVKDLLAISGIYVASRRGTSGIKTSVGG